jgi:hypothetical protein
VTAVEASRFLALTRVLARDAPPQFPVDMALMREVHNRVSLALKVRWRQGGDCGWLTVADCG